MSHRTIIDGYNLLHAAGLVRGKLVGKQLEGARQRLMKRLAYQMTKEDRASTIVVFDAKAMLAVSTKEEFIEGIRILYPEPGHEADELIEQMISQESHPRKLRIVSSDRRLHRAARERMATAINSDRFLDELDERRRPPSETESSSAGRTPIPVPRETVRPTSDAKVIAGDVDYWMKEFGEVEVPDETELTSALERSLTGQIPPESPTPSPGTPAVKSPKSQPPTAKQSLIIPLPPRPGIATLPSRAKGPVTQVTPELEPLQNQPGPERIDADLEFWKDALKQVLDEERQKP